MQYIIDLFSQYWLGIIISLVIAYLIGSINFAIVLTSLSKKRDIRKSGSGNAGATNMLRTYGVGYGAATLALDALKGFGAAARGYLAGLLLYSQPVWELVYLASFASVLGHVFPLYFSFKGGKGISTALGFLLFLDWRMALCNLAVWIIVVVLTRMVSLGSVLAAISVPIAVGIFSFNVWGQSSSTAIFGTVVIGITALLVIIKHGSNIKRIFNGTESKLSFKKKKTQDQ